MPKFTQGKWEISDDGCIKIYDEKGLLVTGIAEVADYNTSEGQANARLIASAPKMYRWLLEVLGNEKIHKSTEKAIEKLLAWIDKEENKNV